MVLTLAQARSVVQDHLDDDGTRWSTAQIDVGLGVSLSSCLHDYVSGGGDRFDVIDSFTSTSTGLIDMSAVSPLTIRGMTLIIGQRYYPILQRQIEYSSLLDSVSRNFEIRYSRILSLPTNTAHPLVGAGATSAGSWDTFDHWICARAAMFCTVKDAEQRPELLQLEQTLSGSVMTTVKIPSALPFPGQPRFYGQLLAWTWRRESNSIQIVRKV
jgi:hypothetical protein